LRLATKDSLKYSLEYSADTRKRPKWQMLIGKEFDLTGDLSQQEPPLLSRRPLDRSLPLYGHLR
jgi:hypothetical protein